METKNHSSKNIVCLPGLSLRQVYADPSFKWSRLFLYKRTIQLVFPQDGIGAKVGRCSISLHVELDDCSMGKCLL